MKEDKKELKEKFLPIGTIVRLKGGEKKAMILSYLIFPTGEAEIKEMYDYGACAFPQGVIDSKTAVGFNHEDIEEIIHMGLMDEEYQQLNDLLKKHSAAVKSEFQKAIDANKAKKKAEEKQKSEAENKEENETTEKE